jgi:hypothetical protein
VGALLILVADAKAPGLEALIPVTDGALLVGDTRLESPAHVIARARPRGPAQAADAVTADVTAAVRGREERAAHLELARGPAVPAPRADGIPAVSEPRASSRRTPVIIGITLAAALVALAGITATRRFGPQPVETASTGELAAPVPPLQQVVTAPPAEPPPPVENPQDSARAAAFSVALVAANTSAGAEDNLRRVSALPAATAAPSIDGGVLWYKVFVGAFETRAEAESLRDSLRAAGPAGEIVEPIVTLPFAFLVANALPRDSVAAFRTRLAASGVVTYALVQADGTARVFAGAFTTPEEAMQLAPVLRSAGIQPRIVYRTGRPL